MIRTTRLTLVSLALLPLVSSTTLAQVTLDLVKTIDLTPLCSNPTAPEYIGTNPSAVAFANGEIYVAGYNNAAAVGPVGISRKSKVTTGGDVWSAAFGVKQAPVSRGYSGLDVDTKSVTPTVFAAYDPGASDPDGITAWNGLTGAKLWAKNARGSSGDALDPGHPNGSAALGSGLGWLTLFGNGRALQHKSTGADIWSTANGMSLATSQGAFFRDIDFDPATGDAWVREGNNVIHGIRNGDNSFSSVAVKWDALPDADTVNGQNLAFCSTQFGSFIIYNDRSSTPSNQAFSDVIRAIRPDGSVLPVIAPGFTTPLGNGFYDFAYDAKSETLVICDFANRKLYQFTVELSPFVPYGNGCAGFGGFVPQLIPFGAPIEGNNLQLTVAQGLPGSSASIFLGLTQASIPIGVGCFFNLGLVLPASIGPLPLFGGAPGTGTITIGGAIPAGTAGLTITMQAFVIDPNVISGYSNTKGVLVKFFAP
jgi:hypothetical protein